MWYNLHVNIKNFSLTWLLLRRYQSHQVKIRDWYPPLHKTFVWLLQGECGQCQNIFYQEWHWGISRLVLKYLALSIALATVHCIPNYLSWKQQCAQALIRGIVYYCKEKLSDNFCLVHGMYIVLVLTTERSILCTCTRVEKVVYSILVLSCPTYVSHFFMFIVEVGYHCPG